MPVVGDTWPKRRRVAYAALIFCACLISAAMGAASVALDMSAVVSIAGYAFMLGGSVIGSYVFGSIWDDTNKHRAPAQGHSNPGGSGRMNQLYFTAIIIFVALMTAGTGYAWLLHEQNESLRQEINIVQSERDAAGRAIDAMAAERAAADLRTRASVLGKDAINSIPEGNHTPASEILLKSPQAANSMGGIK